MAKVYFLSDLEIISRLLGEYAPTKGVWYAVDAGGVLQKDNTDSDLHLLTNSGEIDGRVAQLMVIPPIAEGFDVESFGGLASVVDFSNELRIKGLKRTTFAYINNPNGRMRWIFPVSLPYPSFLSLYNASNRRAILIQRGIELGFKFGLKRLLFNGTFTYWHKGTLGFEEITRAVGGKHYSIFTGTVGKNRKCIIEVNDGVQTTHFVKFPLQPNSERLIAHEKVQLAALGKLPLVRLRVPEVVAFEARPQLAILSNVRPSRRARSPADFTPTHLDALLEMYDHTAAVARVSDLPSYARIGEQLGELKKGVSPVNDLSPEVARRLSENLFALYNRQHPSGFVTVARAHTDFTAWNMYLMDGQLFVYDWELSRTDLPIFFDAFHFLYQSHILVKRSSFEVIWADVVRLEEQLVERGILEHYKANFSELHAYYHLYNASYYLLMYLNQPTLHLQAHWLVNIWTEATEKLLVWK